MAKAAVSYFALLKYLLGQFTRPNVMSAFNVPVLLHAAHTLDFLSNPHISDRIIVGARPLLLNGYRLFQVQMYIAALIVSARFGG